MTMDYMKGPRVKGHRVVQSVSIIRFFKNDSLGWKHYPLGIKYI